MKNLKIIIGTLIIMVLGIYSLKLSAQSGGWACVAGDKGICTTSGDGGYRCLRVNPDYLGDCDAVYYEEVELSK